MGYGIERMGGGGAQIAIEMAREYAFNDQMRILNYETKQNKFYNTIRTGTPQELKKLIDDTTGWFTWDYSWSHYKAGLQLAAQIGRLDMIIVFVEKGTRVDENDNRALRWAAYNGHDDVVKYLISKKANTDCLTPDLKQKYKV